MTLLVGRHEGHPACKKTEWWGAGVVICLERCVDLHMAQLMPLPLTVSCFSEIQIGFTFLVPAHLGSPRQRAVKRVCVCVRACVRACVWVAYFSTFTRLLNTTQYVTFCSVSGKSLYLCARVVCYDTTEYYVYFVFFVAFRVDHCLVFWVKVMPSSLWKNLSLLLNGSVLWRV